MFDIVHHDVSVFGASPAENDYIAAMIGAQKGFLILQHFVTGWLASTSVFCNEMN